MYTPPPVLVPPPLWGPGLGENRTLFVDMKPESDLPKSPPPIIISGGVVGCVGVPVPELWLEDQFLDEEVVL